jgi:hypothetical protein
VARPRNSHDVHVAGRERGLDHKSGEVIEKRETYGSVTENVAL